MPFVRNHASCGPPTQQLSPIDISAPAWWRYPDTIPIYQLQLHEHIVSFEPRIVSIATAVPPHVLRREDVAQLSLRLFHGRSDEIERLLPIYENSGIDKRHSCVPLSWFEQPHNWAERAELYLVNALDLIERAARDCLARADLKPEQVDGIVCVSSTGIATPSLEARLLERMQFRRNVQRTPLFGLGCAGGVLGLARAAQLARGAPGQLILLLVVELCTLTFRAGDQSNANIVATALFGDGAAALLVSTESSGLAIRCWGEHCWPDSLDVMGWRIEEDGFGVQFSRDIPPLVRFEYPEALDGFLARQGLKRVHIERYIFHPGGRKVLQALEEGLALGRSALSNERDILRQFGNMSAVSVLFVLERQMTQGISGLSLLSSLGPGFTAAFLILEGQ
jgi:alkylresorcinol/alkylpyrone synthase